MNDLRFSITSASAAAESASPALVFRLRIQDPGPGRVHALALRCQLQIEPRPRRYSAEEQRRLYEVFGPPADWARNLQTIVWMHLDRVVPGFDVETEIALTVPCSYDVEVAAGKYLFGVRDGDIPLRFCFTGSVFRVVDGRVRVEPVPWDADAAWRMPASLWRSAVDRFFPDSGWIRLSTDTMDALAAFRASDAHVNWDDALKSLLRSQQRETGRPA